MSAFLHLEQPQLEAVVERLGWVLVHSLWQFALIALVAGIAARALRRNTAALRYGVLLVAMAAFTAAPVATWLLQPQVLPEWRASRSASATGLVPIAPADSDPVSPLPNNPILVSDSEPESRAAQLRPAPGESVAPSAAVPATPIVAEPTLSWSERFTAALRPWLAWIVAGWSLGVALCSLRPLLGWRTLRRLQRVGVSPATDDVLTALARVSARLGLARAVCVMQSTLVRVPVVVGYLRPVILLPVSLVTTIPALQLDAILAHELAHIGRHDFLVNLIQMFVETLFFYHPAVWWLSHQIRVEREHCCDDLVVRLLDNRIEYGRALVAIEQLRGENLLLALGAADGSLLARVRRIVSLNPATSQSAAVRLCDRWPVVLVSLASFGIAVALSMCWNLKASDGGATDFQDVATYIAHLPDGIVVELIGIGDEHAPVRNWWRADGKRLDAVPTDRLPWGSMYPPPTTLEVRNFVYCVTGLGREQRARCFSTALPEVALWQQRHLGTMRGEDMITALIVPVSRVQPTNICIDVTSREWWLPMSITPGLEIRESDEADPRAKELYGLIRVNRVSEEQGIAQPSLDPQAARRQYPPQATLAIEWDPLLLSRHAHMEFHAVEKSGTRHQLHAWGEQTKTKVRGRMIHHPHFACRLADVDHFEIRLQPIIHRVTFEKVSLKPGYKTDVTVSVNSIAASPPHPCIAELPDGIKVEFAGITPNTAPAREGWRPDGSKMGDVPEWQEGLSLYGGNVAGRGKPADQPLDPEGCDFLFEFKGLRRQPFFSFELPGNGVFYSHDPVQDPHRLRISTRMRDESKSPGAQFDPPADEVRVGLTDEPWGPWQQISPTAEFLNQLGDDAPYRSSYARVQVLRVGPSRRDPNRTVLVRREPKQRWRQYAFEIRAFDTDGLEHWVNEWQFGEVEGTDLLESESGLAQLLPEGKQLARYEYRLRPFRHRVTFKGVSLKPGKFSDLQISVKTVPREPGDDKAIDDRRPGDQPGKATTVERGAKLESDGNSERLPPAAPIHEEDFWSIKSGAAWPLIGKMRTLERVRFVASDLRGRLGELTQLQRLRELRVVNSRFEFDDLADLVHFPNLEVVDVMFTVYEATADELKAQLGDLSADEQRWLDAWLASHPANPDYLQTGRIALLTDRALLRLSGLNKLKTLRLSNTDMSDRGLAALNYMPLLEEIDVSCVKLDVNAARNLARHPRLRSFRSASVTGDVLTELAQLTNLEQLSLWGKGVTDVGAKSLSKCTKLRELTFRGSDLTDIGLDTLSQLPDLRLLELDRGAESVTPAGVARFRERLPNCRLVLSEADRAKRTTNADKPQSDKRDRDGGSLPVSVTEPEPQPVAVGPPPEVGPGRRLVLVQWSHDSKQVFASGDFNKLTLWEHKESGWSSTSLDADHHVNSIAASRISPLIAAGTNVGTAEVWDASSRKRLGELRSSPDYSVYAVAISADDRLVAACGTDGTVAVFDRASQQLIARLGEKADTRMSSLAFSPDGKALAAMDRHGHVVLWNLAGSTRLAEWKGIAGGEDCSVQWSPDGQRLAVSGPGRVTLIAAEKGSQPNVVMAPEEVLSRYPQADKSVPRSGPVPGGISFASVTAIAPDIRTAASIAPDASIGIWDLATRKIIQKLPAPAETVIVKDSAAKGLRNLVFSPDGQRLACTTVRGDIVFWQLAPIAIVGRGSPDPALGATEGLPKNAFDPIKVGGSKDDSPPATPAARVAPAPAKISFQEARGLVESLGGEIRGNSESDEPTSVRVDLMGKAVDDSVVRKLAGYPQLTALSLWGMASVTDDGMAALAHCGNLKSLQLQAPAVGDVGAGSLAKVTGLTSLTLSNTAITDDGLKEIATLPRLEIFDLTSDSVGDAGMRHLAGMLRLRLLRSYCPAVSNDGFKALAQSSSVEEFRFGNCKATEQGVAHLAEIRKLKSLSASYVRLSDESLKGIGSCANLEFLDFRDTDITDAGLAHLAGLTKLVELHCFENRLLTGEGLAHLRALPLKKVTLVGAGTTDKGLEQVAALPQVSKLDVGGGPVALQPNESYRVTDAGLKSLTLMPSLAELLINGASVTDAGVLVLNQQGLKQVTCWRCPKLTPEGQRAWQAAAPHIQIRIDYPAAAPATGESKQTRDGPPALNGLRTRLTLLTDKPAVGLPLTVKLELQNTGTVERTYASQRANPEQTLEVIGPDSQPVEFINGPNQIQVGSAKIKPGETVTLFAEVDVASMFLLAQPGKYSMTLRGPDEFDPGENGPARIHPIPTSNTIEVTLGVGTLNDLQATFVRVRGIAPKGWTFSARDDSIVGIPPDFKKGDSRRGVLHLKFLAERKTEEQIRLDPVPYEYLGQSALGYAYLALPTSANTDWPGCAEQIRRQLPSETAATPTAPPHDAQARGQELNGLRTRMILLTGQPAVGRPFKVRIELQNAGTVERKYPFQRANPDYLLEVVDPDGKPAEFINGGSGIPVQTLPIKPGETVVLFEEVDVASMFLLAKAGRYKMTLRGPARFDVDKARPEQGHPYPTSNTLEATLADGHLSEIQATFLRIRAVAPKDSNLSTRGNSISSITKSVTRRGGVHLFFSAELKADDLKLGGSVPYEYLGETALGHAYLAVLPGTTTEWPDCVDQIRKQLPVRRQEPGDLRSDERRGQETRAEQTETRAEQTEQEANRTAGDILELVRRFSPSIVAVSKTDPKTGLPDPNPNGCAGVIVDGRGYILTMLWATERGGKQLRVRLADQHEYLADVVATDANLKLAVLRIQAPWPLPAVSLSKVRDPQSGDVVVAIPSPGQKEAKTGIVTGLGKDLGENFPKNLILSDLPLAITEGASLMVSDDGEPLGIWVGIRAGKTRTSFAVPLTDALPFLKKVLPPPGADGPGSVGREPPPVGPGSLAHAPSATEGLPKKDTDPAKPGTSPGDLRSDDRRGRETRAEQGATRTEQTNGRAEQRPSRLGTLTGRFVYDGEPPIPVELFPQLAKLEANSPLEPRPEGAGIGMEEVYRDYLKHGIRPKLTNDSLLIGADRGVANVLIWVTSKNIPWSPPEGGLPPATITLKDGNFSPRIATVVVGQPLVVENLDPVEFDFAVEFWKALNAPVMSQLKAGIGAAPLRLAVRVPEPYPARYSSRICPWAAGSVFVHRNSYFAVSRADGSFTLSNLPPGEWEFRVWHERAGYVSAWPKGSFAKPIASGENSLGTIALKPEQLGQNPPASAPPPKNREQVGEVLGKPVYRDQVPAGELDALFFVPVRKKYHDAHEAAFTPTLDEIKYAAAYFDSEHQKQLDAEGGEAALRSRLEAIELRLAQSDLTEEEEQKLEQEHSGLKARLKPPGSLLAAWALINWKGEKHIYDNFGGGRVLVGKFGHTAFDANRVWRETLEKQGEFQITDPKLRAKFYEPWKRDRGNFLKSDKEEIRRLLLEPEYVAPPVINN